MFTLPRTARRCSATLLAAALGSGLLLCLATPGQALDPTNLVREKQKLKQDLRQHQSDRRLLEQGLFRQQQELEAREEEHQLLVEELAELNKKLVAQQTTLARLEEKLQAQEELIRTKAGETARIQVKKEAVLDHLRRRLTAYYTMDKIGVAQVAFSSESFPELLRFHDAFGELLAYDQELISSFRLAMAELDQAMTLLTREKEVLAGFVLEARAEEEELARLQQEQQELISQIQLQQKLHRQAMAEMEQAADDLDLDLSELTQKGRLLEQGFLLHKGQLTPPLTGGLLVRFGQEKSNRLGIKATCKGIVFKAEDGEAIKALYKGQVSHAGYLRGFGNSVIINHGHGYSSQLSRLENILVKKGQQVKDGQLLGHTGPTANLIEDGVLLKIIHQNTPQDPLGWLDKEKIPGT